MYYNENDEMFETEVEIDDVAAKKALIEEAKALDPEADWKDVAPQINALKKAWKRLPSNESMQDENLRDEFEAVLDVHFKKQRENFKVAKATKEALIKEAKALADTKEFGKANTRMNDMMGEWKASGSAGSKDVDDQLWEEFNKARKTFFDRRAKDWENRKAGFEAAKVAKEALVEKAKELAEGNNFRAAGNDFKKLMEDWKAAGSAGKAHEDELWTQFNAARQTFFDRRNAFYAEMNEKYEAVYNVKKGLVDKAAEVAANKEYTKENTAELKNLQKEWKAAGFCGKEKEDALWADFRAAMDDYFAGLKAFNDAKHADWVARMKDAYARKQELINNQERQIKRLEAERVGAMGDRELQDIEMRIADKQEFIDQLKAELADLEKRIG
ncbi:MAG: DUF349 domain-containing protein [Longicatena sp.]|nr:DUF349 domain-containing protein [Longicatena sp.]